MTLPPWFVRVRFRSDVLYQWAKAIPGVYWSKVDKCLLVPVDVVSLLEKKAIELEIAIHVSTGDRTSDNGGATPPIRSGL